MSNVHPIRLLASYYPLWLKIIYRTIVLLKKMLPAGAYNPPATKQIIPKPECPTLPRALFHAEIRCKLLFVHMGFVIAPIIR